MVGQGRDVITSRAMPDLLSCFFACPSAPAQLCGHIPCVDPLSSFQGGPCPWVNECNGDVTPIDESSTCSYIVVLETCSPPMPPAPERAPEGTSCLVSTGQAAALESAGRNLSLCSSGHGFGERWV
jgi:hypothetical protein